jgi:hypothetical protein
LPVSQPDQPGGLPARQVPGQEHQGPRVDLPSRHGADGSITGHYRSVEASKLAADLDEHGRALAVLPAGRDPVH